MKSTKPAILAQKTFVNRDANRVGYTPSRMSKLTCLSIYEEKLEMKMQRVVMAFLFTFVVCGAAPPLAKAQSSSGTGTSPSTSQSSAPSHTQPGQTYQKPTNGEKVRNYLFDAFGPYAIIGSAVAAGINQASGDRVKHSSRVGRRHRSLLPAFREQLRNQHHRDNSPLHVCASPP